MYARFSCLLKSAKNFHVKLHNLTNYMKIISKMQKKYCQIFRNKVMLLFQFGVAMPAVPKKYNDMQEFLLFLFVFRFHVFGHMLRCICFIFLCASLLIFFCHFTSLIILLSTQCLFAAAFYRHDRFTFIFSKMPFFSTQKLGILIVFDAQQYRL